MSNQILRMEHISKAFSGVKALDDVSFELVEGEVHALMGANGAGKSTLMKILAGVYPQDDGQIFLGDKQRLNKVTVSAAQKEGVAIVFQELTILPHLSVLENIFISNEICRHGLYNWKAMRKRAREVMGDVGIELDLNARADTLSVAMQQMVEIVRALNLESKIIIFDEPTSSLSMQETVQLFELIEKLKAKGTAMVYISHRMDEIYKVADRITLMRDGKIVFTDYIKNVDNHRLITGIVGSENTNQNQEKTTPSEEVIFEASHMSLSGKYQDISFQLKKGEILGFAGLAGSGRTDIAKTIFGYYHLEKGEFKLNGKELKVKNPDDAVKKRIGYVSEDRKGEGILGVRPIKENMSISSMHILAKRGVIKKKIEQDLVRKQISELKIKATDMNQRIENLSGGNQQKVCLGKWLMINPALLLLDEPTKGIDVGTRADFYRIIKELAMKGIGIIVISSEEEELMGLCNRIIVMRDGEKVGELDASEEKLKEKMLKLMLNI